jgi:spore coat polysaccharide biosynthesis protein SpsF
MKTIVILQARIDSTRLPGKALLPLGGRPMILRVMEALNKVDAETRVLACPEDAADAFAPLAKEAGFELFVGPKEDVLARYCMAIRHIEEEFNREQREPREQDLRVIRATGDNPFVFADAADALNRAAFEQGADYAGYGELPYGAGVESVASEALFKAEKEAFLPAEREHVCPYLYGHPERFKLYRPSAPAPWRRPDIRLTVDTKEDYERMKLLWKAISHESGALRHRGESIIAHYDALFGRGAA